MQSDGTNLLWNVKVSIQAFDYSINHGWISLPGTDENTREWALYHYTYRTTITLQNNMYTSDTNCYTVHKSLKKINAQKSTKTSLQLSLRAIFICFPLNLFLLYPNLSHSQWYFH